MSESQKGSNIEPHVYKKGVDIPQDKTQEVWNFLVCRGKDDLKDTAFVTGNKFTSEDITKLKQYYQEVFNYQERLLGPDGAVFNSSLREHLLLSERIAKEMSPILGLDKNMFDAQMLTHDFGRIFSHRRGRNDAIGKSLEEKLGFSRSYTDMHPEDTLWTDLGKNSVMQNLHKMTENNGGLTGMIVLADVLAKWKDKDGGVLRKFEDVTLLTKQRQNQPDKDTMWPSEFFRQQKITSTEGDESIATKYNYLKDWFEEKSGMKINDFIAKVEDSLRKEPLKTSWV